MMRIGELLLAEDPVSKELPGEEILDVGLIEYRYKDKSLSCGLLGDLGVQGKLFISYLCVCIFRQAWI
jgi:hypothetical protein